MDGNKRTLLLATKSYLKLNGYFSLFPLRIKIRNRDCWDNERGTDVTDSVIIQISNWIKKYVTKEDNCT